jgi:hypothetical protein
MKKKVHVAVCQHVHHGDVAAIVGKPHAMRVLFLLGVHSGGMK